MKIPYQHILNRLKNNHSIEEISNVLFQLGHEHEVYKNLIDIEFTPNRGDCLSLNGILRDLSVFFELKKNPHIYEKEIEPYEVSFENSRKDLCPNISFLRIEVENIVRDYKDELNNYFVDLGLNKNNFFTDISNFVSYETGQPTHCYDSKKIDGLVLEEISENIDFLSLLNKEIKLDGKNLVFKSHNNVVNLAGVIGGMNSACEVSTNCAIVECAYFKPESIIGKSIKYDIQSEAAHKFERGVDPQSQEYVLRRFIKLVEDHANIKDLKIFNQNNITSKKKNIIFDVSVINKILGTNISKNNYMDCLERLNFSILDNKISVPSYRSDISTQNDLAEEVARVIGYDNIPKKTISIPKKEQSDYNQLEIGLKKLLIDNGFFEVINTPFISTKSHNSITVDNPLDSNKKYLRNDLKTSLVDNLLYNERRQKDSIKFFEISNVYTSLNDIASERVIGLICSGRLGKNYEEFSKKLEENYVKEILKPYIDENYIKFENVSRKNLDTKFKKEIIYLEVNLNRISPDICNYVCKHKAPEDYTIYQPISDYPSSSRDLSFSIKDFDQLPILEKFILNYQNEILKDAFVFDYYLNEIKEEIKLGIRLVFQSKKGTIVDKDVDNVLNDIISTSISLEGVDIPGLNR